MKTRRRVSTWPLIAVYIPLLFLILAILLTTSGCATKPQFTLMETPAIYHGAVIDPFAHLNTDKRDTVMSVFYATNRMPHEFTGKNLPYDNTRSSQLRLGQATLRFGDEDFSWDDLYTASISPNRDQPVHISLQDFQEAGKLTDDFHFKAQDQLTPELAKLAEDINSELEDAQDKEIMVYVHGTKVDFLNSIAMTAEIDHFTGRDFVGVAFSWPSHQNILYYLFGIDVLRAMNSSGALRVLLEFLANHTNAKHINLLSYSAGGRVLSKALHELRQDHAHLSQQELREKYRFGAVIFAAADVPLKTFHDRLPAISDLAEQVVVTVSDHDPALEAAEKFMGGGLRIGEMPAEGKELALAQKLGISNFEVIDLSLNQEGRGFDIVGHHYWYRHPWASSDIVLLLRTNLPPHRRGLSPAEFEGVFYMSENYPEEAREATRMVLGKSWLEQLPH